MPTRFLIILKFTYLVLLLLPEKGLLLPAKLVSKKNILISILLLPPVTTIPVILLNLTILLTFGRDIGL